MRPYRTGIVGATGLVGQRLLQRLEGHPWFEVAVLAASERSVGKPYLEAARWSLPTPPPPAAVRGVVAPSEVASLAACDLVLSGLDAEPARRLEPALAAAGLAVISNSSAHRMVEDVPLLVPEVNAAHLSRLDAQCRRAGPGFIVTNPNCSVTGLVVALAPLHRAFGVRRVFVATMQAVSGAGLEGPRALELVDNVIPWIPGEEDKIESELSKILDAPIAAAAHCHRVFTLDGHLEAVSVELDRPASPEEVARELSEFRGDVADRGLPSSPPRPIVVRSEVDRPQPRLDRDAGNGMTVTVGRIRRCPVSTVRFEVLSHNTIRGAAGGTLLNAELLAVEGRLPRSRAT